MLIVVDGWMGRYILDQFFFCLRLRKKLCILFNVPCALHLQALESLGVVGCNPPQVQGVCSCSVVLIKIIVVRSVRIPLLHVDFQLDIDAIDLSH